MWGERRVRGTGPGQRPAIAVASNLIRDRGQFEASQGGRDRHHRRQARYRNFPGDQEERADGGRIPITATDIGAFPDQSAAAALQRIPGVSVNRLQSADDSTHPSGEPTQVLIRGLPFVKTEFNGRDSFSANSARGLQFNDVSPELLAGDRCLQEPDCRYDRGRDRRHGQPAHAVAIRPERPGRRGQRQRLITAAASKKWTPEFSALVSDTWTPRSAASDLLADYAWSHVVTRTESVIMDKIDTYCSAGATAAAMRSSAGERQHAVLHIQRVRRFATGRSRLTASVIHRSITTDIATAWRSRVNTENLAGNLRATVQYIDSKYHNAWIEHASHAILDGNYFGTPAFQSARRVNLGAASTGLTFGPDGMLTGGVLTQGHGSFFGTWAATPRMRSTRAPPSLACRSSTIAVPGDCDDVPRRALFPERIARFRPPRGHQGSIGQHPVGHHAAVASPISTRSTSAPRPSTTIS